MPEKIARGGARFYHCGMTTMLIDPYPEGWLDRLNRQEEALQAATSLYLLINGAFLPGLHRLIKSALSSAQTPTLLFEFLPGCSEETRDVSPFLFRYQPSNVSLRGLLGRCSGWPMVSVVETTESQSELAERLAAWCVVGVDGQRFNFRFPDTRRLPCIFDALTVTQRTEFCGPASRWSYIDRSGSWVKLPVLGAASAVADRPELDDKQFAVLVRSSEIDEVLAMLEARGHKGSGLHAERYAGLNLALRTASKAELDPISIVDWCEFYLLEGPPWDALHANSRFAQWTSQASLVEQSKPE